MTPLMPMPKLTPELTEEAKEELKSFYVNIRNKHKEPENKDKGMKPILISQEDLVNIKNSAEDFAIARGSDVVEVEDARKAIKKWKGKNK